jgi:micrococcal nuclease
MGSITVGNPLHSIAVGRIFLTQRLLASVYVSDVMVNAELVRQGYAQMATYPPNVRYADRFRQVQQEARTARSGCWKAP